MAFVRGNGWVHLTKASNAENVSIWWRHHDKIFLIPHPLILQHNTHNIPDACLQRGVPLLSITRILGYMAISITIFYIWVTWSNTDTVPQQIPVLTYHKFSLLDFDI